MANGASDGAELIAAALVIALVKTARRNANDPALSLAVSFPAGFVGDELGNLVGIALQAADAFRRPRGFDVGSPQIETRLGCL